MKLCCQIWHSRGLKCPECIQPEVTVLDKTREHNNAIEALLGLGYAALDRAKECPTYSDLFHSIANKCFDTAIEHVN